MIDRYKIFVGANQRIDGTTLTSYPSAYVRLSYEDANGNTRSANLEPDAARDLAKALKRWADAADPPKPRRKS